MSVPVTPAPLALFLRAKSPALQNEPNLVIDPFALYNYR